MGSLDFLVITMISLKARKKGEESGLVWSVDADADDEAGADDEDDDHDDQPERRKARSWD